MTIVLDPSVIDGGANNLALANKILICSSVPTTYAGANTATLGTKNFGIGNVFGPKTNWNSGRCIFSTAFLDGVVSSTGSAVCWAVVDDANTRLLATGPIAPGTVSVISGKAFALNSFGIYLLGKGSTDSYDVTPNRLTRCHFNGGVISDDGLWGTSGGPLTFAINAGRFGDGVFIDTDLASEARCGQPSILTTRRGTLSFWARPTVGTDVFTTSGGGQAPFSQGTIDVGPSGGFRLSLTPGSSGGMENQQYFGVGSSTIDIPANALHFFAWTWQGQHHKLYHGKLGDPSLVQIADQIVPSPFVPVYDVGVNLLGMRLAGYGHAVVMDEFETENFAATFAELNAKFLAGSGAPVPILEAHGLDAQVSWLPGEGAGYVMLEAGNAFATRVDHAVVDFYCSGALITTLTVSGFVNGWAASKVVIETPLRPGTWVATVSLYTATNILLTRQNTNSYTLPSTVWLGNNYGSPRAATVLLLHMDGTSANQFMDATGLHSVSKWAGVSIDSQSVFGGASMRSDGTGFLYNIQGVNGDLNFNTSDFTIDFRVRLAALGTQYRLVEGIFGLDIFFDGSVFVFYQNGTRAVSSAASANQWYHLALTRASGQTKLFVDGVQQGATYADSTIYSLKPDGLTIGANSSGGGNVLNGWIDEFRIVRGVAAWIANFTPPTSAYALPSTLQPPWTAIVANVPPVLLLHLDGADGSTTFTDATGRHVPTFPASASISTAQSKFGGSSGYFDGAHALQYLSHSDFIFGTGDFIIDCWFRIIDTADYRVIFNWGSGFRLMVYPSATVVYLESSAAGFSFNSTDTITTNQWYHVAVSRKSGQTRLFLNGVQQGAPHADTAYYTVGPFPGLSFGNQPSGGNNWYGWLDEIRIVKGYGIDTNFTPPTSAYGSAPPVISVWGRDCTLGINGLPTQITSQGRNLLSVPVSTDTVAVPPQLLLHMDGTNGSTTFTDVGGHPVSALDAAHIDTAQSQFGGASARFTAASFDYLQLNGSADFAFGTGDFTIDMWIRLASIGTQGAIYDGNDGNDSEITPLLLVNSTGFLTFGNYAGGTSIASASLLAINTWYHVAVVRLASTTTLYLNGVSQGSATDANNYTNGVNRPIIGSDGRYSSASWPFNGWIDEYRVLKGTAAWTGNFTPPTSAYSSTAYPCTWTDGTLTFDSFADDRVAWTGTSTSSGILRTVKGSIEYDGLMQFDVTLAPIGSPVTINTIKQNTKVPGARALYFSDGMGQGFTRTYDPTVPTVPGAFISRTVFPPCPSYVLSDDDVGLEWWSEGAKNWLLNTTSSTTPYQQLIVDSSGNVVIENSFINVSFSLAAATTFSFGLMATPVKDLPSTWRFWQVGGTSGNTPQIPGTFDIFWVFPGDNRRNGGTIWPSFHECPDNLTDLQTWITNITVTYGTMAVSWAPFFNQHLVLASRDPSVDGGDSDTWPLAIETQGDSPGWQWQVTQGARDYRAYCQNWMQTAGSINAIQARYTDEPFVVYNKSRWPWSGGSVLPDATTVSGYNLLGMRKDFQRLRQGLLDNNPPLSPAQPYNGVIWVNGSTPQMVPHGLSHVTIVSDGEGISWGDPVSGDPIGSWGGDSIIGMQWLRGMSRAKKFGFVQFFLDYINFGINTYPTQHIAFWRALVACLLIHDIPVVSRNVGYCAAGIWSAFTSFGMTAAAVFNGYWKQAEITAAGVFISYWLKPSSVLAVIANHGSSAFSGNVTFNAEALGLIGTVTCKDANIGTSITISGGNQIAVTIPAHDYIIVQFDASAPTNLNLVTNYSAVGDGVTNNDTMFLAFRDAARLLSGMINLTIPSGDYNGTSAAVAPFDNMKHIIASGYGATMPAIRGTCMNGFPGDATHSARVQQVTAGATSCTLVNLADVSRFAGTVGRWCALDALEMQSSGGYPPNHHYMQFVQITAINTGTGVISFTPAANKTYKATYPDTSSVGYDTGGPATLHLMVPADASSTNSSWDTDITFKGITFKNRWGGGGLQVYFPGRRVRLTDCMFDTCAPIPTSCQDFLGTRVTVPVNEVENDKDCELVIWDDCDISYMTVQSTSIQQLTVRNCRIGAMGNTARNTLIQNTDFSGWLRVGAGGYGYSETVVLNNVSSPIFEIAHTQKLPRTDFSLAAGVLTYTGSDFPAIIRFAIPGAHYYFGASGGGEYSNQGSPFTITDVSFVSGHVTMATTLAAMPVNDANHAYLISGAVGALTVINSYGCPDLVDASLAPAGSMPYTYVKRTGNLYSPLGTENFIHIAGRLVSIKVNVTRAYTGAQSTSTLQVAGIFGSIHVLDSGTWLDTTFGAVVNLKIAGLRTFTPTTTTGLQSGDSLSRDGVSASVLGNLWFVNTVSPYNGTNMSADTATQQPIIEYEIITDQSG